jgi:hypothetical protein
MAPAGIPSGSAANRISIKRFRSAFHANVCRLPGQGGGLVALTPNENLGKILGFSC